jgi:hypothetical protein
MASACSNTDRFYIFLSRKSVLARGEHVYLYNFKYFEQISLFVIEYGGCWTLKPSTG